MNSMQRMATTRLLVATLGFALAGCTASTALVEPCCYDRRGEIVLAHLADVQLRLKNGSTIVFGGIFPDFRVDDSLFGRTFPFQKADIRRVTYASLQDILQQYDTNENAFIEAPELTTLYVHEAARGLGYPVAPIAPGDSHAMIVTSQADISALVLFVERRLEEMAEPQQQRFRDLGWLGAEVRERRFRDFNR